MNMNHQHSKEGGKFELTDNNQSVGVMTYRWSDKNTFAIEHTEVDDNYQGQGLAGKLLAAAVKYARENNYKIIAICAYVKGKFEKHPDEYKDVIA